MNFCRNSARNVLPDLANIMRNSEFRLMDTSLNVHRIIQDRLTQWSWQLLQLFKNDLLVIGGIIYVSILFDGDEKTYQHLVELNVYCSDVKIRKEECSLFGFENKLKGYKHP